MLGLPGTCTRNVNSGLAEDFDPEEHLKMLKARYSDGQAKRK
jgi:hypothetical protein